MEVKEERKRKTGRGSTVTTFSTFLENAMKTKNWYFVHRFLNFDCFDKVLNHRLKYSIGCNSIHQRYILQANHNYEYNDLFIDSKVA
jgi:hypothetical protein